MDPVAQKKQTFDTVRSQDRSARYSSGSQWRVAAIVFCAATWGGLIYMAFA